MVKSQFKDVRDSKYLKLLWDAAEERKCGEIESAINRVEREVEDADEEILELGKEILEMKDKVQSVWRDIVVAAKIEKSTLAVKQYLQTQRTQDLQLEREIWKWRMCINEVQSILHSQAQEIVKAHPVIEVIDATDGIQVRRRGIDGNLTIDEGGTFYEAERAEIVELIKKMKDI
jgi:predicted  nucleic acid-binding Zn-ribbon protein